MEDCRYSSGRSTAEWALVDPNQPELYKYPIWKHVPSGETVIDGWSQPHTAPTTFLGTFTLWQYVRNGQLAGFEWAAE